MKLIVGLGNPGRKYTGTRHNIGFEVIGELARRYSTDKVKDRFNGETVEATIESQRTLLLCPSTYMNKSGSSVLPARDFYKIACEDLLVVCDDFNLPLARLRFRAKGSAGGQKGLANIIQRLGTDEFPRLRIGIGPPPDNWDVADYVLSKFRKEEFTEMEHAVLRAADAVACWIRDGVQDCMNRYNANTDNKE
ncbi:MAG: aminoacyl-tRNA hydrolase [Pirellulaceae bacterium]|nr:aminoacyl-tRNA hydrolase [Pirellulaceae bacterium]